MPATPSASVTLRLIPFSEAHFDRLAGWFSSEREVVQWGGPGVWFPLNAGQLQAMVDQGRGEPPARAVWMAECRGDLVGHAQLGLDWRNGNALLARVAVAPGARGQGLAAPMLRLVLGEAFARPAMARVELSVYPWNAPAIRAYQRLGFVTEGVRRSSARVGEERWDTVMMGLLRAEWERGDF